MLKDYHGMVGDSNISICKYISACAYFPEHHKYLTLHQVDDGFCFFVIYIFCLHSFTAAIESVQKCTKIDDPFNGYKNEIYIYMLKGECIKVRGS